VPTQGPAVLAPPEAVFEKEDTTVVYTISSLPRPTKVKTGKRNDNYVVLEEGLAEGQRVALRDPTLKLEKLGGEVEREKPAEGPERGVQKGRPRGVRRGQRR